MKQIMKVLLALLIALALTVPAFADEAEGFDMLGQEVTAEAGAVDAAPEAGEAEGGLLEQEADETDGEASLPEGGGAVAPEGNGSLSEGAGSAEAETEGVGSVKYCFIVGDTLFAEQEAQDGETIIRPDDPEAPEDMAFEGWFLEDGTELFVDADDDGEIDPVIASVDPLRPEVNVYARFAEGEKDEEEDDSLRHGEAVTPPSEREAFGDEGEDEDKNDTTDEAEADANGSLVEGAGSAEAETEGVASDAEDIDNANDEISGENRSGGVYAATEDGVDTEDAQDVEANDEPAEGDNGNDGGVDAAATDAGEDGEAAQKPSSDEESKGNAENEAQKPSPDGGPNARESVQWTDSSEDGSADPRDGGSAPALTDEVPEDETTETDEVSDEATSSVTADAATEGAYRPGLAENSPQESFPGAAAPAEGEASGDEGDAENEAQKPSPLGEGAEQSEVEEVVSQDETKETDEAKKESTSSVTADAATEGAYRPGLAENSPQESFPGAAAPAEGEGNGEEPAGQDGGVDAAATEAGEAVPADIDDTSDAITPTPLTLAYTGEAQALVSATGDWLFSLDGENYGSEIPTAVNAGEYTVYFIPAGDTDAEAQILTVTIAKADVSFTPPVAATEAA